MVPIKYCPACALQNKRKKLKLRQINFRLAVYLCENNACPYPEGYDLVKVEQRSLNELSNEKKQQLTEEIDLDCWLKNFFASEDKEQPVQNNDDGIINDNDLSKIIDEISQPYNENDLDLQYDDILTWIDDAFDQCNLSNVSRNENVNKELDNYNSASEIENNLDSNSLNVETSHTSEETKKLLILNKQDNFGNFSSETPEVAETSVISENSSKLSDTIHENIPKQYRILNFEQFCVPVNNNTDISCNLKTVCNNEVTEPSKSIVHKKNQDSNQKQSAKQNISSALQHVKFMKSKLTRVRNKSKNVHYIDVFIKSASIK